MGVPSANDRAGRIEELTRRLTEAGASYPDPAWLAQYEVDNDSPVLAEHLLLRSLWNEIILPYRRNAWVTGEHDGPVSRMRACGVSDDDISRLAAVVALDSILLTLQRIDLGYDEFENPYPGWQLMETGAPDGELTGRPIEGLLDNFLIKEPAAAEDIAAGFDKPEIPRKNVG